MAVTGASGAVYRVSLPGLARQADAAARAIGGATGTRGVGDQSDGGPDGVGLASALRGPDGAKGPGAKGPGSFGEALVGALDAVDTDMKGSDKLVTKAVRGESVETHELMMALEKADLSVRLMTQVGRRAVEAYREIMRMNV